ncbi:unnamed protein product [Rhizophagus irregularis]|nr:unnamed protein product [Rhizophagus irregularis]CAB5356749.1 unnamed protein product [Rhizophagus irregularis]
MPHLCSIRRRSWGNELMKPCQYSVIPNEEARVVTIISAGRNSFIDLRLSSEFLFSPDQNLQDHHKVFEGIDNDYVINDNYHKDFFNADHGHQGWCEVVRSIVIWDKDLERLKDT